MPRYLTGLCEWSVSIGSITVVQGFSFLRCIGIKDSPGLKPTLCNSLKLFHALCFNLPTL